MKSMTGYGKGSVTKGGRSLTFELKAVNNRYLEINSRLPKSLACCDDVVRHQIQSVLKRGTVEVFYNYVNNGDDSKSVIVDQSLAAEYVRAAKELRVQFKLENDFQTTALLRSPEVLKLDVPPEDTALLRDMAREAAAQAVRELDAMRVTEGTGIRNDLEKLTGGLIDLLEKAAARAPVVVEEFRSRLKARMEEYLIGVEVDQARLLNEVAFFADKADINEEIQRLTSHIDQFVQCLNSEQPQGRKLDFISQEMNREINTMGSKSNDSELTACVIRMKNELEKIKEQIRNVE